MISAELSFQINKKKKTKMILWKIPHLTFTSFRISVEARISDNIDYIELFQVDLKFFFIEWKSMIILISDSCQFKYKLILNYRNDI